jgi:SPP1 gp7 family putative phage head morphogenesis protein
VALAKKKKSLVKALAETKALQSRRNVAKRRISAAKRAALAPRPPTMAIEQFQASMRVYAARVERAVERRVLSRLPVLGSGDPLDLAALEQGLSELAADLHVLADRLHPRAVAAGTRVSEHGRREVSRMLSVEVPKDASAAFSVHNYAENAVLRMKSAGAAQVAQIRAAIANYTEGDSMREDIRHALWVSRNRSAFVARDESFKFHRATIAAWSSRAGSSHGIYVTCRDDRVRATHRANDGKVFPWGSPPSTLMDPGCRCRMLPVEATYA